MQLFWILLSSETADSVQKSKQCSIQLPVEQYIRRKKFN